MRLRYILPLLITLAACTPNVPDNATPTYERAEIYPDYYDVTIPQNIAPLNFMITDEADEYIAHVYTKDDEGFTVKGPNIRMDIDQWRQMLQDAQGDTVYTDIYLKTSDGWKLYQPLKMAVAEPIDPYVTYRQIEPSYVNFETMRICQRNLEDFTEEEIFNNCTFASDEGGQCINCHVPQDYNREGKWQMHVRIDKGGTLISDGNSLKKINLKRPGTISAGVYPAWHPTLPLIVYSNNNTLQTFHSSDHNKIEVQDSESDLVLYDVENDDLRIIANDSTEWETFPAWSPDGKYLYYVSATVPALPEKDLAWYRHDNYKDIKYNVYRKAFDASAKTFGATDTVYMASAEGKSAILPRISPDGRYLLLTVGEYGTFHIWHHDADLYLMDLASGEIRPLDEANSEDTESYHSWSSNGRWILMSSRREDGNYTRLYISYFDKDGKARKPFLLPQADAMSNRLLFKSYNIPEFMVAPNTTSKSEIIKALEGE